MKRYLGVEVERTADGRYTAIVNETTGAPPIWQTVAPLSRHDLLLELRQLDVDLRDALSAIESADHYFSNGTAPEVRRIRGMRDRIIGGVARPDDVQSLISELMSDTSLVPRWFLVGVLSLASPNSGSTRWLSEFLTKTRDPVAAELALQVLCDSSPDVFLSAVRPFVRGVEWDSTGIVRSRAINFARPFLERREGRDLFDDIADGAVNPTAQPGVRRDARRLVARLAQAVVPDNVFELTEKQCLDLVARARRMLNLPDDRT